MWAESQRRAQHEGWPEVDRLLHSLPPRLHGQAKLLEYDFALRYSETGRLRDAFLGTGHFPATSLGTWLLADTGVPEGAQRTRAEHSLLVVSLLLAMRAHTLWAMADASSFTDDAGAALVAEVTERTMAELHRLLPPVSDFWPAREDIGRRELEAVLARRARAAPGLGAGAPPEAWLHPRWAALGQTVALAAAEVAGADGAVAVGAVDAAERLAMAFAVRDELESMQRDLQAARVTYPIALVAHAAGIPLDPPPAPTEVLGALVATGSLPRLVERAAALAAEAATAASTVRLATLAEFARDAATALGSPLSRAEDGISVRQAGRPLVRLGQPVAARAIDMATRFLLSDRTLRESWETHREGMFRADEVASRYPAGLVLEILDRRGHDVAAEIEQFLEFAAGNGFRYYDHPWSDPDTDTLGVTLRLRSRSRSSNSPSDEAIERILDCLEQDVRLLGRIPVWIRGCAMDDGRPPIIALGEDCATVAAHLLLGLLALPPARLESRRWMLDVGAAAISDSICAIGIAANVNYPPAYALAVFFRLLGGIGAAPSAPRERLMKDLEDGLRWPVRTPQAAALATIACRDAGRSDLMKRDWSSVILRGQRPDGSWSPEPFAAAPNRDGWVSWYSSSTLTTALCLDALAG